MKSLRKYEHINATTVDEAVSILRRYGDRAWAIVNERRVVAS
jgi:hypothetical protein